MILYRHPTPDAPAGLCYGRLDIGLAPQAEAEIAAARAAAPRFARVLASPRRRARALAKALARGAEILFDERLAELDFGRWEGRRWDEIDRAESDPWAGDVWRIAPPGGESFAVLHARVAAALAEAGPEDAVVTHAGPIRAALMIREGRSLDEVFAAPIPFASAIHLAPEAQHG